MSFLGVEHACVVGLSMGGGIAIDFALSYPEASDALVAVDSLLGGYRWREFGASLASVWWAARQSGIQAAKEVWLSLPLFASAREQTDVASRLAQIVADYSGWHFVNEDPAHALDPPAAERLAEIRSPTLVVVGERDVPDFCAIADALREGIPDAREVVLPAVGHMSNMEDPARLNEALLSFLAGIRSP